jgi:signal transduction histidine kinase
LNQERTTWMVVLFLLLGVLVPTASVLWFINASARSEAAAARQTVTEAYRGQLRLVRGRIDSYWNERAALLAQQRASGRPSDFKRIVIDGLADSVVLVDDRGSAVYPAAGRAPWALPDERPEWQAAQALESSPVRWSEAAAAYARLASTAATPSLAARAVQAEIRCLVKTGNREDALRAIERHFGTGGAARGTDSQGRLIAADELLLSMQLLKPGDPRFPENAARLATILNDYDGVSMPSAQRLFLMNELQALRADRERTPLPTYAAERLAASFLEAETVRPDDHGFRRSRTPDVWTFVPNGSRIVALYRTETILASVSLILEQVSSPVVRFTAIPPGGTPADESISAGGLLPDWRIAFSVADSRPADALARRRVAVYAWAGFLVIATIAGSALMIGRSFQHQLRLTGLKTDLVAAVSHELKTPLSSMRLLVDSLLDDTDLDPKKARDYLQMIASENLRLSRLIDNFLTFSRIERNRHQFDFTDTDPARVVSSAVETMRERLQPASCHFTVEAAQNLPVVRADENALVTALLNLLDNACKYTLADKHIVLHAYREASHVVFAVRDNGIGISPKEQKRIFRRFYRVDQRLARDNGGCGLGLSIVEFIARAHGGTITVESHEGVGSTFRLSLPCRGELDGAAA